MTDDLRLPDPCAVAETMPQNWGLVFRHYAAKDRVKLAHKVARICKARRVFLSVACDWRLACAVDASGLHMPEGLTRNCATAPHLNACKNRVLTVSAHDSSGLRHARALGADAVFLSPVEPTQSHANTKPLGRFPFAALAKAYGLPTYALGGVTLTSGPSLIALGAAGIAGISLVKELV